MTIVEQILREVKIGDILGSFNRKNLLSKTIADITGDSAGLKGQTVSLRAKVIKVSKNVMGKNWITLQDGTGTEPDNKLIATSTETVMPGEIVTVSGVIHTDLDLGAGYHYDVLLEEATFLKNN